jgi:hypothetical protein
VTGLALASMLGGMTVSKKKGGKRPPSIECPHCHHKLDRDFLMESVGRIISRLRTTYGGPDRVLYKCNCGEVLSAREMREHKCPVKPKRGDEKLASTKEREAYFASHSI